MTKPLAEYSRQSLADFARESLAEGRGEWWIVSEMERRWQINEPDARALVASVSPAVYRRFLLRRRAFLAGGVILVALSGFCIWRYGVSPALSTAMPGIIGLGLIGYGWAGLRRQPRGDAPTSLPGRLEPQNWRQPFDLK